MRCGPIKPVAEETPERGRGTGAGRTGRLPLGQVARGAQTPSGACPRHDPAGAPPRAHGHPSARCASRRRWPTCGPSSARAHRSPTSWPRVALWRRPRWPRSGDLQGAIAMLADRRGLQGPAQPLRSAHPAVVPAGRPVRAPAGDVPRARELFERILRADREAYDVADRLVGLGPARKARPPARSRAERGGTRQGAGSRAAPKQ